MTLNHLYMDSPVGQLKLVADDNYLVAVLWENEKAGRVKLSVSVPSEKNEVLIKAKSQLTQYFSGARTDFDLPLKFQGTSFQQKVWQSLLTIRCGKTQSYLEVARVLGRPRASRAVGAAVGRNPISIICPCHRVVGANGKLTGFAGGLAAKKTLLELEEGISSRGGADG